jgi:hypothetical protein
MSMTRVSVFALFVVFPFCPIESKQHQEIESLIPNGFVLFFQDLFGIENKNVLGGANFARRKKLCKNKFLKV